MCFSWRMLSLERYLQGDVMISNYSQKNKSQDSLKDRAHTETSQVTKNLYILPLFMIKTKQVGGNKLKQEKMCTCAG